MAFSDDECDQDYNDGCPTQMYNGLGHPLSKAEQRRSNKPIMEKRRRARINHCLNELKALILDATKKDPARHSKLEKADILEMTVKHLHSVQRHQLSQAVSADPYTLHKFKTGFNECATEVNRYVCRLEGIDPGVRQRLVAHLAGCVTGLQQLAPLSLPTLNQGIGGLLANTPVQLSSDINNNSNNNMSARVHVGGVQLVPSRLPTGELALLLPPSLFAAAPPAPAPVIPAPIPATRVPEIGIQSPDHQSAFTAVSAVRTSSPTSSSQDDEEQSHTTTSPDTPPSSARALHLSRVAADSSTSTSTPESSRSRTSAVSSSTASTVKTEPTDESIVRKNTFGHDRSILDYSTNRDGRGSLKRSSTDSSEAEADTKSSKIPRFTASSSSVSSREATSTYQDKPSTSTDDKGDMWRPW